MGNKRGWQLWLTCGSRMNSSPTTLVPFPHSFPPDSDGGYLHPPVGRGRGRNRRPRRSPGRGRGRGRGNGPRQPPQHGFNLGPNNYHVFACHHIDLDISNPPHLQPPKRQSRFFPTHREPTPPLSRPSETSSNTPSPTRTVSPTPANLDGYPDLERTGAISPFALPSPLSLPSPALTPLDEVPETSLETLSVCSTLVGEASETDL